jgi:hypothetical protein
MWSRMSAATLTGDLSKYRDFQLGTDLSTVANQASTSPTQAKVVQSRPALLQELEWRPLPLGWSDKTEAVQGVVFSFFDGKLYRIEVSYDRREIEGLTTADLVERISATYGTAEMPPAAAASATGPYGDEQETVASWQNPEYRFDLIRTSYGPGFKLVGVLTKLEASAQDSMLDAAMLDHREAPQREAARVASEVEAVRANLEKARLANKPNFRP